MTLSAVMPQPALDLLKQRYKTPVTSAEALLRRLVHEIGSDEKTLRMQAFNEGMSITHKLHEVACKVVPGMREAWPITGYTQAQRDAIAARTAHPDSQMSTLMQGVHHIEALLQDNTSGQVRRRAMEWAARIRGTGQ